jgi:uncharacterized membrane protein YjjB (DUF3815 family)
MKFLIRFLASIGFYSAALSLPSGLISIGLDMYLGISFLTALLTGVKVTIGMFAAGIVVAIFSIGLASMYREYKENGDFNWLGGNDE